MKKILLVLIISVVSLSAEVNDSKSTVITGTSILQDTYNDIAYKVKAYIEQQKAVLSQTKKLKKLLGDPLMSEQEYYEKVVELSVLNEVRNQLQPKNPTPDQAKKIITKLKEPTTQKEIASIARAMSDKDGLEAILPMFKTKKHSKKDIKMLELALNSIKELRADIKEDKAHLVKSLLPK